MIQKYNNNLYCEIFKQLKKKKIQQPLLQSSVSLDPSEIILICGFGAQETFLNSKNSLNFSWFSDEQKSSKQQHLFKTEIFGYIINVFTVTWLI